MFFQGYYFSVKVGFERLLQQNSGTASGVVDTASILQSFGIINLRVNPNPATLTLNGSPLINGEKKFVDYGDFEIFVEQPGYIPLTLDIELSRNHSFYLNTIQLFKNPTENVFSKSVKKLEKLGGGYLLTDNSGSIWNYPNVSSTGVLVQNKISGTGGLTDTGGVIASLGEGYFSR